MNSSGAIFSSFKTPPFRTREVTVINWALFPTPIGPMYGGATEHGVCFLEFTNRKNLGKELKGLCNLLNGVILPGSNRHLIQLQTELFEYFKKERTNFSVSLHAPGTAFEQVAWRALAEIAYGTTCSYKQQAARINKPRAIRAVASANARNRLAVILPCHRVVGADGCLRGYAAGLEKKSWLIAFERCNHSVEPEALGA